MFIKERPKYKAIYQRELAEEITGKTYETITQRARRHDWTLASTIKEYLKEENEAI